MIPISDIRKFEVRLKTTGAWVECQVTQIEEGEVFRMTDPEGKPFKDKDNDPSDGPWTLFTMDERAHWMADILPEDKPRTDTDLFEWLANLYCKSYTLAKNDDLDHNKATAEQWITEFAHQFVDVPEKEIAEMKATDTIWNLQIYEYNQLGATNYYGPTLRSVVTRAMNNTASTAVLLAGKRIAQ